MLLELTPMGRGGLMIYHDSIIYVLIRLEISTLCTMCEHNLYRHVKHCGIIKTLRILIHFEIRLLTVLGHASTLVYKDADRD
jgi:hypothetical protein